MFGFLNNKPPPPRMSMLTAVPVRNPHVRVVEKGPGKFHLVAPLKESRIKRAFGTTVTEKSFELDELGHEVWDACDGNRDVEKIVTAFAVGHRVNIREAEVAVESFIKLLIKRNLMALLGSGPAEQARQDKRRRRRDLQRKR